MESELWRDSTGRSGEPHCAQLQGQAAEFMVKPKSHWTVKEIHHVHFHHALRWAQSLNFSENFKSLTAWASTKTTSGERCQWAVERTARQFPWLRPRRAGCISGERRERTSQPHSVLTEGRGMRQCSGLSRPSLPTLTMGSRLCRK